MTFSQGGEHVIQKGSMADRSCYDTRVSQGAFADAAIFGELTSIDTKRIATN
jgi:hypothetical protein